VTQNQKMPVRPVGTRHKFESIEEAARWADVWPNAIRVAVERGIQAAGFWWRYSDMPAWCQPLRPPQGNPIVRDDGKTFEQMTDAIPRYFRGVKRRNREWMRLDRAIRRGQAYRGHTYTRTNEGRAA
jgi:hypothetical protein